MFFFGIGTVLPLILIGALSPATLARWRACLDAASHIGHVLVGVLLLLAIVMILSGFDRYLEARLLQAMPAWLDALIRH